SVVVNTMHSDVEAYVGADAKVDDDLTNASTAQSVRLRAGNTTNVIDVAGGFAGGSSVGGGAAAGGGGLNRSVKAYVAGGATVKARDSVTQDANSSDIILSIAGALAGSGGALSIAGSVLILVLTNTSQAFIGKGATVFAQGNVRVAADLHTKLD